MLHKNVMNKWEFRIIGYYYPFHQRQISQSNYILGMPFVYIVL